MVVRMRSTRSHTGNRRSHHKLTKPAVSKDKSGNVHLRHRMTEVSGMYRERKVLDVTTRLARRAKKTKEREAAR